MKKGLVFLLALFTCFIVTGCGKSKNNNENNENNGNNNGTTDKVKIQTITLVNDSKEIKLEKDNEKIKINDLTLEFFGEDTSSKTGVKNSYKYVLTLELNGVKINSNIYSDPFKRLINSSNLSSTFTVYSIDDIYILKSSTGAQIDGEHALIFDNKGNFIDSYEDISMKIDIEKRLIDYENCITTDPMENCIKLQYKIVKNKITDK